MASVLTQGFIAANRAHETVLLGRGGSDTSASYFAAMLRAHLYNALVLHRGIARGFRFFQHIAHRLFDIGVFARVDHHLQDGRMRMLGRGDQAFRFYSKINPVNRGQKPDEYVAEPYVTPGNIEGPDSPFFGRGGWTWYSGSAAWLFKAGLEWVLGVRASFDGLVVDPCIPARWKRYAIKRTFRGAVYNIEVRNPDKVMCGVRKAWVDGQELPPPSASRGVTLPVLPAGTEHEFVVQLGK